MALSNKATGGRWEGSDIGLPAQKLFGESWQQFMICCKSILHQHGDLTFNSQSMWEMFYFFLKKRKKQSIQKRQNWGQHKLLNKIQRSFLIAATCKRAMQIVFKWIKYILSRYGMSH